MIEYEAGKWHVAFIFRLRGSIFPKAFCWAFPSMLASLLVSIYSDLPPDDKISSVWSSYMFVLGFLIVFRSQQAYSRYWEGTTLLNQVRGEWFNAVSSLFAFCSDKPERYKEVRIFQHLIVRLMSLLYCSALQQVASMEDESFETLDFSGIDHESMNFLIRHEDARCEILLQWIQKSICKSVESGVVSVAPPILSRVFQELSRGIVGINNATKISAILFPFPYAQMVTVMLLITTFVTPVVSGTILESPWWAAGLTFVSVFAFWSINYIAAEIELPFGDDANDLPIAEYQKTMNRFLLVLMEEGTQIPPNFSPTSVEQPCQTIKMSDDVMAKVMAKVGSTVRGIGVKGVPGEGRNLPTRNPGYSGLRKGEPEDSIAVVAASSIGAEQKQLEVAHASSAPVVNPTIASPVVAATQSGVLTPGASPLSIVPQLSHAAPPPVSLVPSDPPESVQPASISRTPQNKGVSSSSSSAAAIPIVSAPAPCTFDGSPWPEQMSEGTCQKAGETTPRQSQSGAAGAPTVNVFVRLDSISAMTNSGAMHAQASTNGGTSQPRTSYNALQMQIMHPTQPNASTEPDPPLGPMSLSERCL